MRYKTMYRLLIVTVFLLLMSIGIYIGSKNIYNNENKKSEEVSTNKKENVEVYKEETKDEEEVEDVSTNFVSIYSECGHTVTNIKNEKNTTKENVINEVKSQNAGYSLTGEQDNVLIFEKTYKGKCHDHYKVKLENDEIVIYKIGDSGDYEFYQSSGVLRETIREDLITALTDGIEAYGLDELYIIMEDIES